MTATSLFSAPISLILNKRLLSQRGGILPLTQQSEDTLRFKLFINSNPSSVRYGLTLQISALRDMSKEHNIDQIPEYQVYIYFPAKSFFHYSCFTPTRGPIPNENYEKMGIDEEQAKELERTTKTFWIKDNTNFDDLRLLRLCCWNASVGKTSGSKLRSESLESELKRIFGQIKTANEIEEACLEIDILLETRGREADKAVWAMHDAAQKDLKERERKQWVGLKKVVSPGGGEKKSWRLAGAVNTSNGKTNADKETGTGKDETPKKLVVPAIIDGNFINLDKSLFLRHETRQIAASSTSSTPKSSPNRYLHPHSFDADTMHYNSSHDDTFDSQDVTLVEASGSQRKNWRSEK